MPARLESPLVGARFAAAMPDATLPGGKAAADGRPNFIVVVTDDMRDSDWRALTKTRDLLGASGTTFPNFMLSTPVCSPSRTSLFTGMYTHNHGVAHNSGKHGGYAQFRKRNLGDDTIASALRKVGYRTGLFGKFLNGAPLKGEIPGGWDQWLVALDRNYYGPKMNENGKTRTYPRASSYSTDILADYARDFLLQTPSETPFLLWFTPRAPHGKYQVRRTDRGALGHVQRERSPDVNEADVSGKPADIRMRKGSRLGKLDSLERKRLELLLATDDAIAAILATVDAKGALANTVVFVLSDNGYMMGSHRCVKKGFAYRESTQVTMLASGLPMSMGEIDERVVANVDIAPTIAALAGVDLPRADGVSILDRTRDSEVLVENRRGSRGYSGLRAADWLYVENASEEPELYDYSRDPYELDNLLASWNGHTPAPGAEAMAAEMAARLAALRACAGASCATGRASRRRRR
jgi:arylsulfatase A-like enzyme